MKNEGSNKGSKVVTGKASGSESRKDRKSGSGYVGSPKKGGHGGKFTWSGDGYSKAEMGIHKDDDVIDSNDPNYEEKDPITQ